MKESNVKKGLTLALYLGLLPCTRGWLSPILTLPHRSKAAFVLRNAWEPRGRKSCDVLFSALAEDLGAAEASDSGSSKRAEDLVFMEPLASRPKSQQLWLDLRGTAIRPNEALAFLQEFVFDDDKEYGSDLLLGSKNLQSIPILELVDKIIVSAETYDLMLQNGKSDGLLLVAETGEIVESSEKLQQSLVRGKILKPVKGVLDPLAALEVGDDGWVMIDQNDFSGCDIQTFTDQVEGMVQFLVASRKISTMNPSSGKSGSCVAITCPTQAWVLAIDRSLKTQSLVSSYSRQTDSGILLANDEMVFSDDDDMADQPTADVGITTALVLPFDLRLWITASQLRVPTEEH